MSDFAEIGGYVHAELTRELRYKPPRTDTGVISAAGGPPKLARQKHGYEGVTLPRRGTDERRAYDATIKHFQRVVKGEAKFGKGERARIIGALRRAHQAKARAALGRGGRAAITCQTRIASPSPVAGSGHPVLDDRTRRFPVSGYTKIGPATMKELLSDYRANERDTDLDTLGAVFLDEFETRYGWLPDLEEMDVAGVELYPEGGTP